jgi:hypothetical protein
LTREVTADFPRPAFASKYEEAVEGFIGLDPGGKGLDAALGRRAQPSQVARHLDLLDIETEINLQRGEDLLVGGTQGFGADHGRQILAHEDAVGRV